jgi:xanthine dehydrogenase accessory factor
LAVATRLGHEGVAFALITVVRAVRPTSSKPGDKAILTENGEWLGWVGGSCAEPTARRAAWRSLEDGECRLIHLTNDETDFARSGVEVAAMTCHSGGSLELYVEPHLPPPSLFVFGRSPIARAVRELGAVMKYRVIQVDLGPDVEVTPGDDVGIVPGTTVVRQLSELEGLRSRASFVVVASHGHSEEAALTWALGSGAAYVGLVASERRLANVQAKLEERGLGRAELARLHAPAGLRIGASTPEEVALSVLSEIVAERRRAELATEPRGPELATKHRGAAPMAARAEPTTGPLPATPPRPGEVASCCDVAAPAPAVREPASPSAEPRTKRLTFSAVVLAAGLSRRMGAPNKLLLPVLGQPMIRHVLQNVLAADFEEVVVVLGHQAAEVGAAIASLGARTVHNEQFASGQVSSVRAGLGALRERVDAVMICLGDQPLLTTSDIRAEQLAFARRSHGSILVPMFGEQRGNPVAIDWPSAEETMSRGTNFGCRHFMDENPDRVYSWVIDNDHFIRDIDQPADYDALLAQPDA